MVSNFAVGAGFSAFIALLIPPYISEVTSDATAAGVVMAVISLAAVMGPALGTFADRYGAHRLVLAGGVLGMAVGFAFFAMAADSTSFFAIDAIVLGVSLAAIAAVGPVFIVGRELPIAVEARRMTGYSLAMPAGQVVAGLLVGWAASSGWSYADRFWLAAVFCGLLSIVTWFAAGEPERELHAVMYPAGTDTADDADAESEPADTTKVPLSKVLWSSFGLFLLVGTLSSVGNNGINSQISNIMPNVYGMSEAETSTLISAAGFLNIVLFFPAGRLMASRGGVAVYSLGVIMRLVGALGMALVGLLADNAVLIAIGFMQILYQASPFARLAQPGVAVRFASFAPGIANGWVIAGSALGGFVGSALGGVLADRYGFNAVNWMGAVAAALSVVVLVIGLLPTSDEQDSADDQAALAAVEDGTG
jgi:predicted MFS family arabinose efflux permease